MDKFDTESPTAVVVTEEAVKSQSSNEVKSIKVKDDGLDFAKGIEIATKTEDAAKVAKDTVHGAKAKPVHQVGPRPSHKATETKPKTGKSACYRCGNENHQASQCRFKN